MDGSAPSKRFVVVLEMRWSVRDLETGREILHCGSETLADWWAERLGEDSGLADC